MSPLTQTILINEFISYLFIYGYVESHQTLFESFGSYLGVVGLDILDLCETFKKLLFLYAILLVLVDIRI